MAYLKRFPIDALKIGQSFIRGVTSDPDDAETAGQMAFLNDHNCDKIQGYYFSKPISTQEMTHLLGARH